MKSDFKEKVFRVVKNIPQGRILTYKEVAAKAGRPKAWRVVGNILNRNYDPRIPCHRVIRSDGEIGGYNRGAEKKSELLRKENTGLQIKSKAKGQNSKLKLKFKSK